MVQGLQNTHTIDRRNHVPKHSAVCNLHGVRYNIGSHDMVESSRCSCKCCMPLPATLHQVRVIQCSTIVQASVLYTNIVHLTACEVLSHPTYTSAACMCMEGFCVHPSFVDLQHVANPAAAYNGQEHVLTSCPISFSTSCHSAASPKCQA